MHLASREHSMATESLVDKESIVYTFLQSLNYLLLMICVHPALINIATTSSPVVDVVFLCVAGSHPCQTY